MTKYIFVTGGVTSSLGKGIISASLAKLLQARGFSVTIQKFDPYINVDPGTLNPYEHGECYVTDDGAEGWVSGNARFTALAGGSCSDVPRVAAPSPPAASTSSGTNGSVSGNARQGCYLFQNQLGSEITITFTRGSDGWNRTFKVGKGVEQQECFDPGKYTYTLDAPPPWGSSNGELEVAAGDRYLFPIRGE